MKKNQRNLCVGIGIVCIVIWGVWTIIPDASSNQTGTVQVSLSPSSARIGTDKFTLSLKNENGQPLDGATINVDINMTTMNMGKQTSQASAQGNGEYTITGELLMGGPWRISTIIALPSGEITNKDFVVNAQ